MLQLLEETVVDLDFTDTVGWTQPLISVTFFSTWFHCECHLSNAAALISSSDLQFPVGCLLLYISFNGGFRSIRLISSFRLWERSLETWGFKGSWQEPIVWFWRSFLILWGHFSHLYESAGPDQWFVITRTLFSPPNEIWHRLQFVKQTKSVYSGWSRGGGQGIAFLASLILL